MSHGQIRVGIGGWTYPPWRGPFYPPGLAQSRELEFASRKLGAIEINATFYGRQSPGSWQAWRMAVPSGFQFAVKGSRFCVTRPKLADAEEGVQSFLAQGLTSLREKLGPVLWMLAPRRQFEYEDIARFVSLLPREWDGLRIRHAIEPRHDSFRDERFLSICRENDIAVVFGDADDFPCVDADTGSFRYARLQRMRDEIPTGYPEHSFAALAEQVQRWSTNGEDAYVFMINGAKVRAPSAATRLQDELGIAPL